MSKLPLVLAITFSCIATPVFADDAAPADQNSDSPTTTEPKLGGSATTTEQKTDGAATTSAPAKATKQPKFSQKAINKALSNNWLPATGKFTMRVASTAAGATLGAPIAAVRLFAGNDVEQAKGIPLLGESTHKPCVWLSRGVVVLPALFVSAWATPIYGVVNGWKVSGDKPFSKECFSLGRLDDSVCPY